MTPKQTMYAQLASHLAPLGWIDSAWCETDPPHSSWGAARRLDDQLVADRTDDAVSAAGYQRLCNQLLGLYLAGLAAHERKKTA